MAGFLTNIGPGVDDFLRKLGIGGEQKTDKKARKSIKDAREQFETLETPEFAPYNPELIEYEDIGPSELGGITVNPGYRAAQEEELAALRNIAERGGRSAGSDLDLAKITNRTNTLARGRNDAIMQNARARGVAGSGAALMAQMANAQNAQNQQHMEDLAVRGQNQQAELLARQGAARIGADLEGTDYDRDASRAKANDRIAEFNAKNRLLAAEANANAANFAQQYGNQLIQSQFDNEYKKRGGIAGADQALANYYGGQSAIGAQQAGNLVGGGTQIAAAYAGAPTNPKEKPKPAPVGGEITGREIVPGDSLLNDTEIIRASPGEVVVPKSLRQHGTPADIVNFVKNPPTIEDNFEDYMQKRRERAFSAESNDPMLEYLRKDYERQEEQDRLHQQDAYRAYMAGNIGQGIESLLTANSRAHGGKPVDSSFYQRIAKGPEYKRDTSSNRDGLIKAYLQKQKMDFTADQAQKNRESNEKVNAARNDAISGHRDRRNKIQDEQFWTKMKSNFAKSLRERSASPGSVFGKAAKIAFAADRAQGLIDQGRTQEGGLIGAQMEELATATNKVISEVGQSHRSAVEALVPQTMRGNWLKVWQWVSGNPTGLEQQAFVKMMEETIQREKVIAQKVIGDEKTAIYREAEDLRKRFPNYVDDLFKFHMDQLGAGQESGAGPTPDKVLPDGTKLKWTGKPGAEYEVM